MDIDMRVNGTVSGTVYRGEQRVRSASDIRTLNSPKVFTVTAAKGDEFLTQRFNARSDANALKARLQREGWRARLTSALPGKLYVVTAIRHAAATEQFPSDSDSAVVRRLASEQADTPRQGEFWSGEFASETAANAAVVRLQADGWVAMVANVPPVLKGEFRYSRPLATPDKGEPVLRPPAPPTACTTCHIVPCECEVNMPLFIEPSVVVALVSSAKNVA